MFNLTSSVQRGSFHPSAGTLHETSDPRFYWNREMYSELLNAGADTVWCVPMIQGYVEAIGDGAISVVLISRRSCYMAGTRFNARGIDDDGDVGNFVETEQLLVTQDTLFSHIQTRGSVPVFWQQNGLLKSNVQVTRSEDSASMPFIKHFRMLKDKYERLIAIDLLAKKHSGEAELSTIYEQLFQRHADELRGVACLYHFDYKAECAHGRPSRLRDLVQLISEKFDYCGFFAMGATNNRQKGVTRINCLDCLDRTNVAMARLAWEALLTQFTVVGISITDDYDDIDTQHMFLKSFKNLWADNGDMLSRQYTGTASVSSSVTRNGKKGLSGLINHGMKTVGRFLSANQPGRQESIEAVLHTASKTVRRTDAPGRQQSVVVRVCTWNLAGEQIGRVEALRDWLVDPQYAYPDVIVVGFQELVPLNAKSVLQNASKSVLDAWKSQVQSVLSDYAEVISTSMVGLGATLFARTDMMQNVREVVVDTVKTGFKGTVGNKGGVAIRCVVYDTSMCFWNCHLESGFSNCEARVNQLLDIHSRCFQTNRKVPPIPDHDLCVLFGDLNFRMTIGNSDIREHLRASNLSYLLTFDQLKKLMPTSPVLMKYREADIHFQPTYKYDLGTDTYDTSKKMRPPAWCDRILVSGDAEIKNYGRTETRFSDHRPVSATILIAAQEHVQAPDPPSQSQFVDLLSL